MTAVACFLVLTGLSVLALAALRQSGRDSVDERGQDGE